MSKRGAVEFLQKVCSRWRSFSRFLSTNAAPRIKMGFREQVRASVLSINDWRQRFSIDLVQTEECITMLVFNPKRMKDLRTGAKCLDDVIKNQVQTIEDAELAKRRAIANEKAARTKVRSRN